MKLLLLKRSLGCAQKMADHERSFYLFLSSVFYVGLLVPGSLPPILDSHSPRSTLDGFLPELLTEEDQ